LCQKQTHAVQQKARKRLDFAPIGEPTNVGF